MVGKNSLPVETSIVVGVDAVVAAIEDWINSFVDEEVVILSEEVETDEVVVVVSNNIGGAS